MSGVELPQTLAFMRQDPPFARKLKWCPRQDLNLLKISDSLENAYGNAQIDAQILVALGRDLSQVVTAWAKLPAPLKAAILAIVNSAEGQP